MSNYYQQADSISVHIGFPNAAVDTSLQALDFNDLLIHNSAATYTMRISGNDWAKRGIFHGDLALIDRALIPKGHDLVAWIRHDEFALSLKHEVPEGAAIWGVVTNIIHQLRKKQ